MASIDEQALYTICVQGAIDPGLADWCGPVHLASTRGADSQVVTTLSGLNVDQAGVVGMIRHLHGLGVILLSVVRFRAQTDGADLVPAEKEETKARNEEENQ